MIVSSGTCPVCTTPLRSNGSCGPCTFHWTPPPASHRLAVRPEPGFTLAAAAAALIEARNAASGGAS